MAAQTNSQGTQGAQGTPQQAPPIPKMEAGPAGGTRTARQIQAAAKADAKAAVAAAKATAKEAQQAARGAQTAAQQGGGSGPVIAPSPPGNPPGELTTSTGWPAGFPTDVPPNVYNLGMAGIFMTVACVLGFPIVRVIARRFDPKLRVLQSAPDLTPQLRQLQESVDTMAIELERISEGQRYATKLLTERAGAK
jgi:hypothetical protein